MNETKQRRSLAAILPRQPPVMLRAAHVSLGKFADPRGAICTIRDDRGGCCCRRRP
jgi:hypothetical protein